MKIGKAICLLVGLMIMCAATAMAQSKGTFLDASNRFSITLSDGWQAASYTDAFSRRRTEFVFGQRDEGLLRISRNNLGGRTLVQVVNRELEDLRFYHGKYLLSGREPFEGDALAGMRIAFYYIEHGRRATGVYYFLEDANAVWILRFTGQVGSLDANRDATDEIARSFRPKYDLPNVISHSNVWKAKIV
jgi:hypothetical protein